MKFESAPLICLMGATASGKSALAMQLAAQMDGEIVSADAMQLYHHIPVGSAQPTAAERRQIRHHLIDCCDFAEKIDVFTYVAMADAAIADIRSRGKRPIVAGGTGFYLKSLLYGLDDLPGDAALRAELDKEYDSDAAFPALRNRMAALDPAGLTKWSDCRRKLIRALEVRLLSGKSILALQSGARKLRYDVRSFVLDWDMPSLRERIAIRTDAMFAAGWLEEGRRAIELGILNSPTAHQAIGYAQIDRFLRHEIDCATMRELIITATGQLARRQRTWFRHQHPESVQLSMPATDFPLLSACR